VRLAQILRSASFKLTAAYVGLFTVSVGLLALLVYFSATSEFQRQMHTRVVAESNALTAEYAHGGRDELLEAIAERQRGRLIGGLDYTLYDSTGHKLFGNLPATRCTRGWTTVTGPPDGDEPAGEMEELGVQVTPLSNRYCLLVGDDLGKVRKLGSLILDSFGWVFLLTVTLAFLGGTFITSRVLKRIEAINRTAEAIIEGDMTKRIPLRGADDDLDRLAATLNRMLDRMTALMESIRHVSNDVAHDLRTPLGRLRRALEETGRSDSSPEEFRAALERSVIQVDSILETFGAILRIAQIESGSRRGAFQRLSLSDLVADVCETFGPSLEETGKTLTVTIEPGLWVHGDRELLVQSLANLLENGIAHTTQGANITVSLKATGHVLVLSVADNGPGVPEEARQSIFKRFYRLEHSRATPGSGLGLSIVAAVADLHGARLVASDNKPGLKIELKFVMAAA